MRNKRRSKVNYSFWWWVLQKPEELKQFLERGDTRQKEEIIQTLDHYKNADPDFFEQVEGKLWLKRFKKK
jgi:hypothetical protein